MKEKKPVVTVKIFGEDYRIKGVKSPDYIQNLARFLDRKMKEVAANTQLTSTNKIAILAALNISDELYKFKEKHKASGQQIREKVQTLMRLIETCK